MGARGPSPKPTTLREFEGNPSHRPLSGTEPEYPASLPTKPRSLSGAAARVWDELVPQMAGAKVLRRVDRRALAQLAEDEALVEAAYAGIWKMQRSIQKQAREQKQVLPGGALFHLLGMKQGRLAMSCLRDLAARTIIERREFGLTPSARTRVHVPGEKSDDPVFEGETLDGNWMNQPSASSKPI